MSAVYRVESRKANNGLARHGLPPPLRWGGEEVVGLYAQGFRQHEQFSVADASHAGLDLRQGPPAEVPSLSGQSPGQLLLGEPLVRSDLADLPADDVGGHAVLRIWSLTIFGARNLMAPIMEQDAAGATPADRSMERSAIMRIEGGGSRRRNRAIEALLAGVMVLAIVSHAAGEETLAITSFDNNGTPTVSGLQAGTTATVQWASSLSGTGPVAWHDPGPIPVTADKGRTKKKYMPVTLADGGRGSLLGRQAGHLRRRSPRAHSEDRLGSAGFGPVSRPSQEALIEKWS